MAAYTGTNVKKGKNGELGQEYTATGYYDLTTGLANADTITFSGLLPIGGYRAVKGKVWGVEIDTNATPTGTFVVGTATDDDGFLTTKGAAVGLQNSLGGQLCYIFDGAQIGTVITDTDLIVKMNAAVATGATSGRLWVELVCERTR